MTDCTKRGRAPWRVPSSPPQFPTFHVDYRENLGHDGPVTERTSFVARRHVDLRRQASALCNCR
ncbi:putative leader peptide [Spirillospora sp. NPDC052269]